MHTEQNSFAGSLFGPGFGIPAFGCQFHQEIIQGIARPVIQAFFDQYFNQCFRVSLTGR